MAGHRAIVFLAAIILLPSDRICLASAAPAADTDSLWSLRAWQSDDGLPNNSVTGLAQTPDGYLWVATPTALARFDGVRFEEFPSSTIVAGYPQRIHALLQGRDGGLWLAMDHGPVVYLKKGTAKIFTQGLPDLDVQTLTEDAEGILWLTYRSDAVYRIKNGRVIQSTAGDGLPAGVVGGFAVDNQNRLWFAKGGWVGTVRQGHFTALLQLGDYNSVIRLARASAGGIWIGKGSQLFWYGGEGKPENRGALPTTVPYTDTNALLEDRGGAVWIGTSSNGLFRYDGSGFEGVPASHRDILSLLEDQEGNLWVGTGGGGLDQMRSGAMKLVGTETGLSPEAILSVCEDTKDNLWAVTPNGLLLRETNREWTTISTQADWPGGRATCVTADQAGAVWIGTKDYALLRWQDGRFTVWKKTDGLISHNIHSLLVSDTGAIWIGGNAPDSLQRFEAGKLTPVQIPPTLHTIRTMTEDAAGDIWLGTVNGRLVRVHGDQISDETANCSDEAALASGLRSIRCLYATPDNSLWIGYAGAGLGRLKNGHFSLITAEQGLMDNYISQIVADDQGWLWMGADHGIFKVRLQELNDVAEARAMRMQSIRYGQSEGLHGLQANFGGSPGAFRGRNGRLWIPTQSGLLMIDPGRLREDPKPPAVFLKRMVADDQTIAWYGGVLPVQNAIDPQRPYFAPRLPPGHHRLEFEFTALSLSAPENVQFRYWLEGWDEGWVEAGTQRSANYSRLPAGNYRFHVMACNGNGIWNTSGATFDFAVEPFIWQTWWFRLVILSLFTALIFATARYVSFRRLRLRLQALEQQAALDKERARIARDIHDDLGGNLTQIKLLFEMVRQDHTQAEKVDAYVQQGTSLSRQAIESLDETVWAINPRHDVLPALIDYISQYAVEFLRLAGIRCQIDLPDHPPKWPVSTETRHNLFLVVKEALNNITRHARAGEVKLFAILNGKSVTIGIEDNGIGFENGPHGPGADGLRNMRQRMAEIGGQFSLETKPGSGTRILLTFSCSS